MLSFQQGRLAFAMLFITFILSLQFGVPKLAPEKFSQKRSLQEHRRAYPIQTPTKVATVLIYRQTATSASSQTTLSFSSSSSAAATSIVFNGALAAEVINPAVEEAEQSSTVATPSSTSSTNSEVASSSSSSLPELQFSTQNTQSSFSTSESKVIPSPNNRDLLTASEALAPTQAVQKVDTPGLNVTPTGLNGEQSLAIETPSQTIRSLGPLFSPPDKNGGKPKVGPKIDVQKIGASVTSLANPAPSTTESLVIPINGVPEQAPTEGAQKIGPPGLEGPSNTTASLAIQAPSPTKPPATAFTTSIPGNEDASAGGPLEAVQKVSAPGFETPSRSLDIIQPITPPRIDTLSVVTTSHNSKMSNLPQPTPAVSTPNIQKIGAPGLEAPSSSTMVAGSSLAIQISSNAAIPTSTVQGSPTSRSSPDISKGSSPAIPKVVASGLDDHSTGSTSVLAPIAAPTEKTLTIVPFKPAPVVPEVLSDVFGGPRISSPPNAGNPISESQSQETAAPALPPFPLSNGNQQGYQQGTAAASIGGVNAADFQLNPLENPNGEAPEPNMTPLPPGFVFPLLTPPGQAAPSDGVSSVFSAPEEVKTLPLTTTTNAQGSVATLPGQVTTLPASVLPPGPVATIPREVKTLPPSTSTDAQGSVATAPGGVETLPPSVISQGAVATLPGKVRTLPISVTRDAQGKASFLAGAVVTLPPSLVPQSVVATIPKEVKTLPLSTTTDAQGSITTISGQVTTLPPSVVPLVNIPEKVTMIPPTISTDAQGSVSTVPGKVNTLPPANVPHGAPVTVPELVTELPPSTSTDAKGSVTTVPGQVTTLPPSIVSQGLQITVDAKVTTLPPSTTTNALGSPTIISGIITTLPASIVTQGPLLTIPPRVMTIPLSISTASNGSLMTIPGVVTAVPASTISLVSIPKISTKPYGPTFIKFNVTSTTAAPASFSTLLLASFSPTPLVVAGTGPGAPAATSTKSDSERLVPRGALKMFLGSVCVMGFMLL